MLSIRIFNTILSSKSRIKYYDSKYIDPSALDMLYAIQKFTGIDYFMPILVNMHENLCISTSHSKSTTEP